MSKPLRCNSIYSTAFVAQYSNKPTQCRFEILKVISQRSSSDVVAYNMAKATRPTIPAKSLLPAASMLAPLPAVKVAGAEVVALVGAVLATPVPVAVVLLAATGKGAGAVMVIGAMVVGTLLTAGADVVTGVEEATGLEEEEAGVEDGVEEVTGAAEALPLGPTQGMVSIKTGKH